MDLEEIEYVKLWTGNIGLRIGPMADPCEHSNDLLAL
jgi:hypothetical protein